MVNALGNKLSASGITHTRDIAYFTGVTSVDYAFRSGSIIEAILPPNVTEMKRGNFEGGSNMKAIVITAGVTSIQSRQFYGCNKNPAIIHLSETPPTYASGTSILSYCNGTIYVPDDSISAYKAADVWSSVASRIYGFSQLAIDHPDYYERYVNQG